MPAPDRENENKLALVMSGGGARAAYQAGVLRGIARRFPALDPPILTGVSAGAINTTFLAAHEGCWEERVDALATMWSGLETERVFDVGPLGLFTKVFEWGLGLVSAGRLGARRRGFVNTAPLRELLVRTLGGKAGSGEFPTIARNIARGCPEALAILTASYTTGRSIAWTEGTEIEGWERPGRISRAARIGVDHVLASAALPLFFPAVRIESEWYGDGGMRMTAPLSPAIHLGADRILAISTRYGATRSEAAAHVVEGYPPPARVAGVLLNSIFLDLFDGDALRMERINHLIEHLPPERRGDLRRVELLLLRPSRDLGSLANQFEPRLPRTFRFLTRGLGTRGARSNDLLSLVMFQTDYLRRLLELGEHDADERASEIEAFLASAQPSAG